MFLTAIVQHEKKAAVDFDYIFENYRNMVWRMICDRIYDEQYRTEIFDDVFFKFNRNIHKINDEKHAANWLKRVTHNTCVDRIRKECKYNEKNVLTSDERMFEKHSDVVYDEPLDNLINEEQRSIVRELVDNLKPKQREIVYLYYQADYSIEQISEELKISINTAYSRKKAARLTLQNELKKIFEKGGMGNGKK